MTATIMDGKLVAAEVKHEVARRVNHLQQQGVRPWISTVLVGDDPASATYWRVKHKACEEVGIKSENHHLPGDTQQDKLEALIDHFNHDERVHGILVQLPLPKHLEEDRAIGKLDPDKDVDGLHPVNVGRLASGTEGLVPCTPKGVVRLLQHYKVVISGSKAT